tara:strand:+ start:193 stop:525 length:333 start_codon:yes stop_codon:yes gene_type:complete
MDELKKRIERSQKACAVLANPIAAYDEITALRAANRDLQQWFDDARAEAEKAQARIKDLEQVATSVRRDLMLRAEPDWDGSGQQVVNLSASIWDELNRVLDIKGNRREGK